MRCEERGEVRVKGIADPVATYVVAGLRQETQGAGTAHLKLEFEPERMSANKRRAAAHALRLALGLLEQEGQS